MEYQTTTQLIQAVIFELSEMPGSGVQQYDEDVIVSNLRTVYNSVCGEAWWPSLMRWSTHVLSGTDGLVTNATKFPATVRDYTDIRYIYPDLSQKPLSQLPDSFNPYALSGTGARYVEQLNTLDEDAASGTKFLFKVWPLESTNTLRVRARHVDTGLFDDPEVIVPIDKFVLVSGACMLRVTSDGNNPSEVTKFQVQYKDALDKCKQELGNAPIELDTRAPSGLDSWQEWPL